MEIKLKQIELFDYNWKISNTKFSKDKGTVFSCFSCGGGSTMGYKLAGFDVIGCNEIDPAMMNVYKENHSPKYSYLESIKILKLRNNLPKQLFDIDILDGSPPCSSFSVSGNREKDWGKEKMFREGQKKQVLDTLFFDFIDFVAKIKPKIVIAENVKGLILGNAIKYCTRIREAFDTAGYYCERWLLDSSKMGIPQKRERVFFIAIRNDIAKENGFCGGLFGDLIELDLNFKLPIIPFSQVSDNNDKSEINNTVLSTLYYKTKPGQSFSKAHDKGHYFNCNRVHPDFPVPTITAHHSGGSWHNSIKRYLNTSELIKCSSFPSDYNFLDQKPKYIIGMSVPPVMMAQISTRIYDQMLSKIR